MRGRGADFMIKQKNYKRSNEIKIIEIICYSNLSTLKCSNMIITSPQLFRGNAHAFFTRYIFCHIFTSENMENTSALACGLQYRKLTGLKSLMYTSALRNSCKSSILFRVALIPIICEPPVDRQKYVCCIKQ